ncbi:methylenetetrahydrofolate reductase [NAD(P)H] [Halotalea alkalilenta]|uniref:methylenetetrahydrofolate reductase [NAD(P)H] n=1 Tax=Halotalea alkalilenta TaxID=376489 RepID=UPI000480184F|nr:methylenetetrahydrofolate reductase [NAD(P)H] [Halotalea alkalilenta]
MSRTFEVSFEFFPPRTDAGREKLSATRDALMTKNPEFCSVTFGAGGSTRDRTLETVLELRDGGVDAVPHLSCISSDKQELRELLARYRELGIRRIVALRGDIPSGQGGGGELRYASELIELIRGEHGDHFELLAAAYPEMHPQARDFESDLRFFAAKMKAGASRAITQYFFDAEAYFHFVERVRALGVEAPIIPGIMPVTQFESLVRFSDVCGAGVPRWIRKQLEAYGDDQESVRAFGHELVSRLCERLIEGGAPGLHFYTLNQASPSLRILDALGR